MTPEPSASSSGAVAAGSVDWLAAELRRWSAGTLMGLLWCAALMVGWRRLAGELSIPLHPAVLLSVGGLVVIVAAGVRLIRQRLPAESRPSRPEWLGALPATAAVFALGATLSVQGTDRRGLVAFWALLVGGELWAWRKVVWPRGAGRRRAPSGSRPVRVDAAEGPSSHPTLPVPADGVPAEGILQQLTRRQAADGGEQLSGWLRAPFAAGQRTANVHVAFCPPFPKTPRLTVEQLDGPEVRIKTAQLLPHGLRLDLKLAATAEKPLDVLLQFSARSNSPAAPATARRQPL